MPTAATIIRDIKGVLGHVSDDVHLELDEASLETIVNESLEQLQSPAGILANVLGAAEIVFPRTAAFRQLAVDALTAVKNFYENSHRATASAAAPSA